MGLKMRLIWDNRGRTNVRLIMLVFAVLSGIAAAILYFPPLLTSTSEEPTRGDITFIDGAGNPLRCILEISGDGVKSVRKENASFVRWNNVSRTRIKFDALDSKNLSVSLRISGNSPGGRVTLENYGASMPGGVESAAPGTPVKYLEIDASNVSITRMDVIIGFTDAEVAGLDMSSLVLCRYDKASQVWSEIPARIDAKRNLLSAMVDSFTVFAIAARTGERIVIRDSKMAPVIGGISTFDESKNLKKTQESSAVSTADIPDNGELDVDAIRTKNVAVKLKINRPASGEIVLDNYGRKNPVKKEPPGKAIKYVGISANLSFDSAEVRISYTNKELGNEDENRLVIYHWNGASWDALPTVVDDVNNMLTATTTSLSPFAVSATGGSKTIHVSTNRYSITSFNNASVPLSGYDSDNGSFTFTGGALVMDTDGLPVSGENVYYEIRSAAAVLKANGTIATGPNGLVLFSYNTIRDFTSDTDPDYGTWTVKASLANSTNINETTGVNIPITGYTSGCSKGYCHHNPGDINNAGSTQTSPRSPYIDKFGISGTGLSMAAGAHIGRNHGAVACVTCHPGYGNSSDMTVDNHSSLTCDNANCHGSYGASWPIPIPSCYGANCHPRLNRNLTNITTLATINGITNTSIYSTTNNSTVIPYSVHNGTQYSNTTGVPCWMCHGPMHNITKPDFLAANRNNITEYTQCTSCHNAYSRHNNSVSCTICHSQDAHLIKIFAQNATYINGSNSTYRGNCTNCHQNSSFWDALLSQPKAGNQTTKDPPQVAVPLEHSDDSSSGAKWNKTAPGYWTNSDQLTWCKYCHGETMHKTSALGRPSLWEGDNIVNSSFATGNGSWCAGCHWQLYASGTSVYNDMVNNFSNDSLVVPPEITGNSTNTNTSIYEYTNHSKYIQYTFLNDSTCSRCHGYRYGFTTMTQLMHNQSRVGGPNCVDCHDTDGIVLLSHVNVTAANDTSAIHKSLNSGASASNTTPYYSNNKRCWACHGDGTEPATPDAHPTNYRNPYNCTDCHIDNASRNTNFTPNNTILLVDEHYWNGTNLTTSRVTTCYDCHNITEMLLSANDPDNGSGSVYGGANGGSQSVSHYGKNRSDLAALQNTTAYCAYCHQNTSTAFPVSNTSISNHTSTPSTPDCNEANCHVGGRIHNSSLNKTINCVNCHTSIVNETVLGYNNNSAPTGQNMTLSRDTEVSAVVWLDVESPGKYMYARHANPNSTGGYSGAEGSARNSNYVCLNCHSNIIRANGDWRNQNWDTNRNCKTCHDLWASDPYYPNGVMIYQVPNAHNLSLPRCTDCHTILTPTTFSSHENYNSLLVPPDAYGKVPRVGSDLNSSKHYRMTLNTSSGYPNEEKGCIVCHTNATFTIDYSVDPINITITDYNGSHEWNSEPYCTSCHPLSGGGTGPDPTNHIFSDLKEQNNSACYDCHSPDRYGHSITTPSCMECHFNFSKVNELREPTKYVNGTMYNQSVHSGLNCTQCHTGGGHPPQQNKRKACEDCHAYQNDPKNETDRHNVTGNPNTYMYGGLSVVNITDCTTCHDSGLYTNATSAYGYNKTRNCGYCHTYPDKKYS